jgi:hypothetical protein
MIFFWALPVIEFRCYSVTLHRMFTDSNAVDRMFMLQHYATTRVSVLVKTVLGSL